MKDKRSLLLSLIIIIPSLFLLFLSAVLSRTVLTPLILLVLLAVGLGVLSRVKPELFERFKKPEEPLLILCFHDNFRINRDDAVCHIFLLL